MKKFLLIAVAAMGLLFTACSKDEVAQPVGGEESVVTFTVEAPVMQTRAEHGDGTLAKNLTYAVYNRADGTMLFDGTATMNDELKTTVEIPFVNGMTYDILFWAESANSPYEVDWDAKTVGYKDANALVSNSMDYDAFYYFLTGDELPEITGPVTKTVELKRPFAQLNIITNDATEAAQSDVVVKDVKVVVKNGYSSFDLAAGEGETKGEVTFGFAAKQENADAEGVQLLAVDYLFTGGVKSLVDVEFTYTDVNGKVAAAGEVMEFAAVPVQRNYRTNIVGSLLTSDGKFNIEIKPGFDGEQGAVDGKNYIKVATTEEFYKAFADTDYATIILTNDIVIEESKTRAADATLTVSADKELTLDLGGKKLSSTSEESGKNYNLFDVRGTLTVKNGTIEYEHIGENMGWSSSTNIFNITAGGVLNIDGVTAKNLGGSDMAFVAHLNNWGEVTLNVNNSILESPYVAVRVFNSGNDLNNVTIKNSTLKGDSAAFWVHNYTLADFGTQAKVDTQKALLNFDIFDATNSFDGQVRLGFTNSTRYTVIDTAEELATAFEEGGAYALNADIESETLTLANGKSVILNLGGHTLSGIDNTDKSWALITNKGNLTIENSEGEGAMTAKANINSGWARYSSVLSNNPGGVLVVEGGVIEHLGGTDMAYGIDNLTNGKGTSAVTTINGGIVKSAYAAIRQFLNGVEATNELTVKAGSVIYSENRAIFFQDPSKNANSGKLVIEQGAEVTGKVHLSVTAGSTEWPVEVSIADSALVNDGKVTYNLPDNFGYEVVLENGYWIVKKTLTPIEGVEGVGKDAEGNYVVVANEGLASISALIAADEDNFAGKTIILDTDVDLANVKTMGDSFAPIGSTGERDGNNRLICEPFKGTFDGNGHTISNFYQSGWDMGYELGKYGSLGLFAELEGATVKNVVIEGIEAQVEGGDISFIAGSATGDCVFENIEIKNSVIGTYNNGCGGIIGWSGAGTYTFKNIKIGSDVVLAGLWGSFDSSIGGIVGQAEPGATYNFENVEINCRIDAYNDCTASYDYYNYRMCGMIIGRCEETTTINDVNYPDLSKYNLSFNDVVVNYGDWMNYHYCEPTPGFNGGRGMRVEPGFAYGGLPADFDHSQCTTNHMNCIPFDQLIGGDQLGVKGLKAVDGVTVNYPASYNAGN